MLGYNCEQLYYLDTTLSPLHHASFTVTYWRYCRLQKNEKVTKLGILTLKIKKLISPARGKTGSQIFACELHTLVGVTGPMS